MAAAAAAPSPPSPSGAGPSHSGTGIQKSSVWFPLTPTYHIHLPKLDQGVLSLSRRKKDGQHVKVNGFKNRPLSKAFQETLLHTIKKQRLPDLSDLSSDDREYLYKLLALSEPPQLIRVDGSLTESQKEKIRATKAALKRQNSQTMYKYRTKMYMKRLQLLVGEAMAGNHKNQRLITEGTELLNLLIRYGVLSREEAERVQQHLH